MNTNNAIIPGKRVNDIEIGWTYDELIANKGTELDKLKPNVPDNILSLKNGDIIILMSNEKRVQEILVKNNYSGKANGIFGIGDCLKNFRDAIDYETNIADSEGFFYFPKIPGLRVLTHSWNEEGNSTITLISVYDIKLGTLY